MGKMWLRYIPWSLAYIVILLSILTPFSVLTVSFLLVPLLVLYVKLPQRVFVIQYTVMLLLLLLLPWTGSLFLITVSLFFLPPVVVMGKYYKARANARRVITAGVVTLLAEMLLSLVAAAAAGWNPVGKISRFMLESMKTLPPQLRSQFNGTFWDQIAGLLVQMLPFFYLIVVALYFTMVTHAVGRRLLNRLGETWPGLPFLRDWRLPRTVVFLYVLALLVEAGTKPNGSLVSMIVLNLLPLLTFAFTIQGIGFLFYVAYSNRWNKALPIAGIIVLFVFFRSSSSYSACSA